MTGTSNTETSRTHDIWPWEADAVSPIPRQILLIQTQWDWNSESVTGHLYCAKLPSCCWSITKKENHSCSWRAGTKTCPRGHCVLTKGGMESKQRKRRISSAWRGCEGFHRGCDTWERPWKMTRNFSLCYHSALWTLQPCLLSSGRAERQRESEPDFLNRTWTIQDTGGTCGGG